MAIEFRMPKLGESVTEGTIGRWLKQPGDRLEQYEAMVEVTTDKVDTEVSSPIDGTLIEILVPEGETVRVGTVIARLAEDGAAEEQITEHIVKTAPQSSADQDGAPTARSGKASPISPAVARLAAEHNVDLRQIPGTGREGRITKKDVEAYVAARSGEAPQNEQTPRATAVPSHMEELDSRAPKAATPQLQETMEAGPRTVAEEQAPQAAPVTPAMPEGYRPAVSTSDLPRAPQLEPGDEIVPLSAMRRAIAEHMVRSRRTAPHVTTVMEVDLSSVIAHRQAHKTDFERQGVNLTFTPYFVQASVAALQAVPIVNASYSDSGIQMHQCIHVGVAVAIPDGLIVPVIKDADEKSLLGFARAVCDLAGRARGRRLQADETQGGTFTISNHGVSGSLFATPIINQPQAAILGVGAIQKRPVVITEHGLDAIAIRSMCYLSLTFDHRLIDGATADSFLAVIKNTLETYTS
jgi:2-oxoisovalerate dehydrogenase E2 component (dihydrolipoyl transacylase)